MVLGAPVGTAAGNKPRGHSTRQGVGASAVSVGGRTANRLVTCGRRIVRPVTVGSAYAVITNKRGWGVPILILDTKREARSIASELRRTGRSVRVVPYEPSPRPSIGSTPGHPRRFYEPGREPERHREPIRPPAHELPASVPAARRRSRRGLSARWTITNSSSNRTRVGGRHYRTRRRSATRLAAAILVASVMGAAGFGAATAYGRPQTLAISYARTVRAVTIDHPETLRAALRRGGIRPRFGRLLAVVSRHVLRPMDEMPGVIVDGHPGTLSTFVRPGDHVTVTDGADAVEPVVTRKDAVPAPAPPTIETHLWNLGAPGQQQVLVGALSGEVVQADPSPQDAAAVPATPITAPQVALTFDDGPSGWTPRILAVLQAEGVKATFCEIGEQVPAQADLVRQIVADGDVLCNHTQSHDEHLNVRSDQVIEGEINQGARAQVGIGLSPPAFYRPPGGTLSAAIVATALRHNEEVLYWTVDPKDWQRPPAATIVARVVGKIVPGAIVLLHDGGGDRSQTLAALPQIIDQLRARGYQFVVPAAIPSNSGAPLSDPAGTPSMS